MIFCKVASTNFISLRLAPATTSARGKPRPSLNWLRFVPRLPRSVGLAPVATPPKGALVSTPSMLCHSQAIPSNSSYSCNPARPVALKHPLLFPEPKAIIDGRARSQFPWQGIPLDTGAQHVQNRRQHLSITLSGPSSFRARWAFRNQRTYSLPELIAQFPWPRSFHDLLLCHVFLSFYHRFPNKLLV